MITKFKLQEEEYRYHAIDNARTVELPLAMEMLQTYENRRILEVGNVLSGYFQGLSHDVVDLYQGPIKEDIVDYSAPQYDLVISISTIEHIGFDEHRYAKRTIPKERTKFKAALTNMKNLVSPFGELFCTWPIAYNPDLDDWLFSMGEAALETLDWNFRFLKRISRSNQWKEGNWYDAENAEYHKPFPKANVIVVARWCNVQYE